MWKPASNAETRRNVATELKEDHAVEMQGKSRDEAVKDFLSGKGWYRGADVDRLSEEEAIKDEVAIENGEKPVPKED